MKKSYFTKKYCRCCKRNDLVKYLDLGNQPLANSYHKKKSLPNFPLEVMLCTNCYHSQLSVVVKPNILFDNYLYVSGTTETFRNHCKELAIDSIKRVRKNPSVLDIACNDGTQLEFFRNLGCYIQGIDPAKNLRKITKSKKIPVVVDYWNKDVAKNLNKEFDLVTATNVFAHVDDLDEFLNAAKIVLKEDGILILEFPYARKMIQNNEFDTVYHEHLSYFTVSSFKALMDRIEFSIVDVLQTTIHGGSIRFFLKKNKEKHTAKVKKLIENEKTNGLLEKRAYLEFSKRVKKNKEDFIKLNSLLKLKKEKIIGYGASAKGNTMLNYFKINLDYIVDDNPLKWEYETPGRNIIIKSPNILKKEKQSLYIVVLSWNFYKEISKKILKLRFNSKDKIILYVPKVFLKDLN
ncbi:MAG TPA: class I SAM-dependent methyltransferase [Candidatus Sulfotelmatobacter sp.]|nr:class I SAM-dependent methyltransferase [Candidatus Sulfotelmatobacter sp.]